MKNNIFKTVGLIVTFLTFSHFSMAQTVTKQDVSIFPKPEAGYKQMVIEVPHSDNDMNKKIEFTIGKMAEVDKCNRHGLMGSVEEKTLDGWGFNYYVFTTKGDIVSTQMACLDNELISKFVTAQPNLVDYNGRLPIVIYVPEGFDVQFKIFKAENDVYRASEVRSQK